MKAETVPLIKEQIEEFKKVVGVYSVFAKILKRILEQEVHKLGIHPIVQCRPKDMANFIGKCFHKQEELDKRNKGESRSFAHSFTDLCGARVIVEYKDQIETVCAFLRANFEVDERNSVDPIAALGASKFEYRPVHLIVSLKKGVFDEAIERARLDEPEGEKRTAFDAAKRQLFERREQEETCNDMALPFGPKFKAEVQVRTLLEHAWATLNHDRMYKGDVELPLLLTRDMNRISAILEEADEDFAKVIKQVDGYRTARGRYLRPAERTEEMARLEVSIENAPHRVDLALRFAQLASDQENWQAVLETLGHRVESWLNSEQGKAFSSTYAELKQTKDPELSQKARRRLRGMRDIPMSAMLTEHGWTRWKIAHEAGDTRTEQEARDEIEKGTLLDGENADAPLRLGKTYAEVDRDKQRRCYGIAFRIAPSDPGILRECLHDTIVADRCLKTIPSLRASLLRAIDTCRRWATAGVCLPNALYQSGFFRLLLEQERLPADGEDELDADGMASVIDSLKDYVKAAELSESTKEIMAEAESLQILHNAVGKDFLGWEWVKRLFILEAGAKAWSKALEHRAKIREEIEKAIQDGRMDEVGRAMETVAAVTAEARQTVNARLKRAATSDCPHYKGPIAIVIGGCNEASLPIVDRYRTHINTALGAYDGTVFCGGTKAGISGIVGAARSSKSSFRRVAYVRKGPFVEKSLMAKTPDGDGYELHFLEGDRYTPLEVIQMWIDLLFSGIDPSDVSVLGINGGHIAAFELRLALSMGARVGVVKESGGAAKDLLDDPDWKDHPRLLTLPDDVQTVKALVIGTRVSAKFDAATRDRIAEIQHNRNADGRRRRNMKSTDREWTDLDPFYKQDIRQRIDYWDVLLEAVGMGIVKGDEAIPPDAELVEKFDDQEIACMAEMEHARWNVGRLSAGQKYGKEKKDKETHPDLIPWQELSRKERAKDVEYVHQILKDMHLGYRVVRLKKA